MITKTRDKEYYMNQRYKILLWQDDDNIWNIEIPALQGCRSEGETIVEALEMIDDAKSGWIEGAIELGMTIPEEDM